MADEKKDNNQENVEIQPGTKKFENMVFRLNQGITKDNLKLLDYDGNRLEEIQKDIFVMPAYVDDEFNLFFIVSKLIGSDWIVAFSQATIEDKNKITDLSEPMPTGKGLNLLGERQPDEANKLLKYFNTLVETNHGEWRLIK